MVQYVAVAAAFAAGLFLLPILFPEVRLRGSTETLKVAVVGGVASAVLGRAMWLLLSIVFLPIVLLGALGVFLVQMFVNVAVLVAASQLTDGIRFKRWGVVLWASMALTVFQTLVRLGP